MTPEQAYKALSDITGRPIAYLRVTSPKKNRMFVVYGNTTWDITECQGIEWGDATEYKPATWRPATVEDAIRAMKGETVLCRVRQTSDVAWVWEGVQLVTFVRGINMPWYVSVGSDVLRFQICEVQE